MFMFMPAKADPATSCLVAMPPSTSQHDARQWATFIPSGRKFYPHFLSPGPLELCSRCSLGERVYWILGLLWPGRVAHAHVYQASGMSYPVLS